MNQDEINFAPDVRGTIEATRSRNIGWREILGELIDNAFDAGATNVTIEINGKELTVFDNGNGCKDLDFELMLTMGRHTRQSGTRLGRFGVGLKDAAWWVGGPTRITTAFKGRKASIFIDWDRLTKWSIPRPSIDDADTSGTRIRFDKISRRFPDGEAFSDLVESIGFAYTPAISNGKQIAFKRRGQPDIIAEKYKLPELSDVVDTQISVDGMTARVRVGVVADGADNPKPGISYTHGFRVILPPCALGCSGYSSGRIAGWVQLHEERSGHRGWKLTRNKDDLNEHKEELGAAVFAAIRAIVIRASQQASDIRSSELAKNLTESFRRIVSDANVKEKRDPAKNKTGRVEPKETGRKRTRLTKTQAGEAASRATVGRMRVEFMPLDKEKIGHVDLDGGVIWLADNHPSIAQAKRENNELALRLAAVLLFVARDADSGTPLLEIFRNGEVAKQLEIAAGRLLAEGHESTATIKAVA